MKIARYRTQRGAEMFRDRLAKETSEGEDWNGRYEFRVEVDTEFGSRWGFVVGVYDIRTKKFLAYAA